MNKQKKEQLRRKMHKHNDGCITTKTITTSNELGSLRTTFIPNLINLVNLTPQFPEVTKQEKNMYFSKDTQDYQARNRLYYRAQDATQEHENHLRDVYHLNDTDITTWSQEDAIQALKDGKFVFRRPEDAKKPGNFHYYGLDVRYRDPSKPADEVGFNTARNTLRESFEMVVDHIAVADPKDALKKVDSFREHKFH